MNLRPRSNSQNANTIAGIMPKRAAAEGGPADSAAAPEDAPLTKKQKKMMAQRRRNFANWPFISSPNELPSERAKVRELLKKRETNPLDAPYVFSTDGSLFATVREEKGRETVAGARPIERRSEGKREREDVLGPFGAGLMAHG